MQEFFFEVLYRDSIGKKHVEIDAVHVRADKYIRTELNIGDNENVFDLADFIGGEERTELLVIREIFLFYFFVAVDRKIIGNTDGRDLFFYRCLEQCLYVCIPIRPESIVENGRRRVDMQVPPSPFRATLMRSIHFW